MHDARHFRIEVGIGHAQRRQLLVERGNGLRPAPDRRRIGDDHGPEGPDQLFQLLTAHLHVGFFHAERREVAPLVRDERVQGCQCFRRRRDAGLRLQLGHLGLVLRQLLHDFSPARLKRRASVLEIVGTIQDILVYQDLRVGVRPLNGGLPGRSRRGQREEVGRPPFLCDGHVLQLPNLGHGEPQTCAHAGFQRRPHDNRHELTVADGIDLGDLLRTEQQLRCRLVTRQARGRPLLQQTNKSPPQCNQKNNKQPLPLEDNPQCHFLDGQKPLYLRLLRFARHFFSH